MSYGKCGWHGSGGGSGGSSLGRSGAPGWERGAALCGEAVLQWWEQLKFRMYR